MAQLKFGSAGVTATEIDLSGPVEQQPTGIPAGVIGTALRGPAFVPVTVGSVTDFYARFGRTDGQKFGPIAVTEWLRNAGAATYLRVLGAGDGLQRASDGVVTSAGFVVGEELPNSTDGALAANTYANSGGIPGRLYFLGAFMSESAGSTVFSSAKVQGTGSITPNVSSSLPIIRGVLMAPSGVVIRLSSSVATSTAPAATLIAADATASGSIFGEVVLLNGGVARQDFTLLLNGHKGTDALYPNVITASFDMASPSYFANVLNSDPFNVQVAGHYLYAHWDVHTSLAAVTGTAIVHDVSGAAGKSGSLGGNAEHAVFLTSGSEARNVGSTYVPNYESWEDRFSHARTPWVTSQKFGGSPVNLFRLHVLDAGETDPIKVSIENIAFSPDTSDLFGTFDVVLRNFDDNDTNQLPLEQWRGLNLDPSSDRYVAKVIGDLNTFFNFDVLEASQKLVVDGNYPNKSKYVRVEVSADVENGTVNEEALPMGFHGPAHLLTSGSLPMTSPTNSQISVANVLRRATTPPVPFRKDLTVGSGAKMSVDPLLYWGVQFEHVTSLTTQNASTLKNLSLRSWAKYFPDFQLTEAKVVVGDNAGAADTAENGVIDSDRFCLNSFTLENLQVVTGSALTADPAEWDQATYVRNGVITANEANKTRALSADDFTQANRRFLKFSFFTQGGFDGVNLFDEQESKLTNAAVVADMDDADRGQNEGPNVKAYSKALDIMKNVVNVDLQLLAIPGIRHPIVTDEAIRAVEERFDAMYVMDVEQVDSDGDNVTTDAQSPSATRTASRFSDRALDSSFAAAYFPDLVMPDPTTGENVIAPPSVAVLGALALNDAVGHPWYAPAGMTRGALQTVLEARVKLSKNNMDALYDVDINPIVAFPGNAVSSGTNAKGGVTVWGQKTLLAAASALDRVNVRRLLIDIRRQVRDIARTITFEPNRETTLVKFSSAITPRLQRIQALSGLEKFKIVIDSSTTTQQDIEDNTIRGIIILKPQKVAEYVSLDFVVTNNIAQ